MRYDRLLADRCAVVTWAGSDRGAGIVKLFAHHGAAVAFGVPTAERGEVIAADLAAISPDSFFVVCDLADGDSVESFMKDALSRFGTVDVLVNSAEGFAPIDMLTCPESEIETQLHIYQRSAMQAIRALAPGMREKGKGSIVNVSSNAVRMPIEGAPVYTAATGSLGGLTRVGGLEMRLENVRVNELLAAECADPTELANAVLFLASDMSSYITASTITADKGQSKQLPGIQGRENHAV